MKKHSYVSQNEEIFFNEQDSHQDLFYINLIRLDLRGPQ